MHDEKHRSYADSVKSMTDKLRVAGYRPEEATKTAKRAAQELHQSLDNGGRSNA